MLVRTWSKSHTQSAIKFLRAEGYTVSKSQSGYDCFSNDKLIFKAVFLSLNYLVSYNENLYL